MRLIILFFYIISCTACSNSNQKDGIVLPKITSNKININDGIQKQEAPVVALEYFNKYISLCGTTDNPQDDGQFWRIPLKGGYGGSDFGTLILAKDASVALLKPPPNGLPSNLQKEFSNLSDNNATYFDTSK